MKTSLNLDDNLFRAAQREALKTGKTMSELINHWASFGRKCLIDAPKKQKSFSPINLGGPTKIDLTSRRDWMDQLDS